MSRTRTPVRFTRDEFEIVLTEMSKTKTKLWYYAGFEYGEHMYAIPIYLNGKKTNMRIRIRSSLNKHNISDGYARNSIRAWVEYYWTKKGEWRALGLESYTQRTIGWETRLHTKIRSLYTRALADRIQWLKRRAA